jgi:ferredoxin
MRVIVDTNICQDHGQCCFSAPAVFELGPDGRMQVLVDEPDEALRADVEEASDVCPVQAITIQD